MARTKAPLSPRQEAAQRRDARYAAISAEARLDHDAAHREHTPPPSGWRMPSLSFPSLPSMPALPSLPALPPTPSPTRILQAIGLLRQDVDEEESQVDDDDSQEPESESESDDGSEESSSVVSDSVSDDDEDSEEVEVEEEDASEGEFGGALGNIAVILLSHVLVYALYASNAYFAGALPLPRPNQSWSHFLPAFVQALRRDTTPTKESVTMYVSFVSLMFLSCSKLLPGVTVFGPPSRAPDTFGTRLAYHCNALVTFWLTLSVFAVCHHMGWFSLSRVADQIGPLTTTAVLAGDCIAIAAYLCSRSDDADADADGAEGAATKDDADLGAAMKGLGTRTRDFFMGSTLHPRVFGFDIKLLFEIKIAWIGLFLLTLSAAVKEYELYGSPPGGVGGLSTRLPSGGMCLIVVAHFLYANACVKGEECVPFTFDITTEKFGWMLGFWNAAGVPLCYSSFAYHILARTRARGGHLAETPESQLRTLVLLGLLFLTYYVWDTANSQKNRFKQLLRDGEVTTRPFAQPQLPWGTLEEPESVAEDGPGAELLCDGWYKYARKIHYACDVAFALLWATFASCDTAHPTPLWYPLFFVAMITHRLDRDERRMKAKYGEDWDAYCALVPCRFIPYIF